VQGKSLAKRKSCAGGYRYGFNGKEKDDEIKGSGNSVDFGERMYDPRLGRWSKVDPLAAKYPNISPFAFVANNPLNAIDPDGRLIIFVNGHHNKVANVLGMSPGEGGEPYWNYFSRGFVSAAKTYFNDEHVSFRDGSSVLAGDMDGEDRFQEGYDYAKANYDAIISTLKPGETIKIITHSEGAAHGEGIAAYIEEMSEKNPNLPKVERIINLSPDEPDEIKSELASDPFRVRVTDENDFITPESTPMKDVDLNITLGSKGKGLLKNLLESHGRTVDRDIFKVIKKVENLFKNNPDVRSTQNQTTGDKTEINP
jgi:RHS repeat-associated protein